MSIFLEKTRDNLRNWPILDTRSITDNWKVTAKDLNGKNVFILCTLQKMTYLHQQGENVSQRGEGAETRKNFMQTCSSISAVVQLV